MSKYAQRERDLVRMGWIRSLPCAVPNCSTGLRCEAAHTKNDGMSRKGPDDETIPLCAPGWLRNGKYSNEAHHREGKESIHKLTGGFWKFHGIDRDELVAYYQKRWRELVEQNKNL